MAFNPDCVGRSYHGPVQVLDRDRHQAYALAVGADRDFSRPLACFAAVYLLGPIVPQLFEDNAVGLDVEHLLHGEQEFSFERPLAFDEQVSPLGVIAEVDRRRHLLFLDFQCEGRDQAGEVVVRARSLFIIKEGP
ncbi:MAG TPA: MaoC family dehydratase N-terminal domain-containing protein [Candidatus Dormibacteraeota bacterium]